MTIAVPAPASPPQPAATLDLQRQSLDLVVRLSIECAAEEQRIETQHTDALTRENTQFNTAIRAADDRAAKRRAELDAATEQRRTDTLANHEFRLQSINDEHESTRQRITKDRDTADATLKKKLKQAAWSAESNLVSVQMQIDGEERTGHKEEEARLAEINEIATAGNNAMVQYPMASPPAAPVIDDALKQRLDTDPRALLEENRTRASELLQRLRDIGKTSFASRAGPPILIIILAAAAGAVGWFVPPDLQTKLIAAGSGAVVAIILGIVIHIMLRNAKRARIREEAGDIFEEFFRHISLARTAAVAEAQAADDARQRRVEEASLKSARETAAAREKAKLTQIELLQQHTTDLAAQDQRHAEQLATADREKVSNLAELEKHHADTSAEIDDEQFQARNVLEAQHAQALQTIDSAYQRDTAALEVRWAAGLRAVTDLLAAGSGIDPRLIDWNSPAWDQWKSPKDFISNVRFGEMKIDLAQLTATRPVRLQLPESFIVPAMLAFPAHGSLLIESDHAGRAASIDAAQLVMARLLTQLPAGRVKFTIFDPVGLGQSFAGFMHLADHDESLVGSRIWTETEHMEQRLADLTEHMETVIQKYLRNEYATIDEYNAQAGELAEPIRFLVIADFPTGFEADSLRRLTSIATTGPRCGVYTIILRDTRQPLPQGSRMEEIIAHSVHLVYKNGEFIWDDNVFKRFPLKLDPTPDEKTLTHLMDLVGKAAKEAKRVEVPFQSIAPPDAQFWSLSSKQDLRVPIGKSGATRLQALRLGVGVAQHALIAGKTGSGKSNLMHTIVTNLAMWYGPDEVEFYLVDFKKGVEFKAYATSELPHARAIAVESDREFGLSVLQRVDAELTRRGAMFREIGAQEINAYRDKTGLKLPRTVLLIDEFQEFFSEDDKLAQEAAVLLDRLVRQGRAFGVHVVLGSQTIGGSAGLARSTLGQIAVRVALQCTEADSQLILGDNNSAARLLTRPGEAVYNDAGGLVEANSPFQIAFLPDDQREKYLEHVHSLTAIKKITAPAPIVFEGNSAAIIRKNPQLMTMLNRTSYPPAASSVLAYVGEPVAIKEATAIPFRRQSGANVLMVGQQEESAVAIVSSLMASIAGQQKSGEAVFYLLDGSPADSRYAGTLERVAAALPVETHVVAWRDTEAAINTIAELQKSRQGSDAASGPSVYLIVFGLQRYRVFRKQEDDFSFSRGGDDAPAPKPDKQFAELLTEGPGVGIHVVIWADTPITVERTLERGSMRQFDHRVLFQMSAADSSNLIDSPQANRLGEHRALLYSEEQGTFEKFRPYEVPDEAWLEFVKTQLKNRAPA